MRREIGRKRGSGILVFLRRAVETMLIDTVKGYADPTRWKIRGALAAVWIVEE